MSGDPTRIERAKHGEQFLASVRAEQRKNAAEMDKQREISRAHIAGASIAANASITNNRDNIDAGKFDKRNTMTMAIKFASLPPATRIGNLRAALASGKDPVTGEPMSNESRAEYQAMMEQDAATLDAANNARGGNTGITLNVPPAGGSPKIVNKSPVTVNPKGAGTADNPIVLK